MVMFLHDGGANPPFVALAAGEGEDDTIHILGATASLSISGNIVPPLYGERDCAEALVLLSHPRREGDPN